MAEVTIDDAQQFVEDVVSDYNTWIMDNIKSSGSDFVTIDSLLVKIDEFAGVYSRKSHNANMHYIVYGVLLRTLYDALNNNDDLIEHPTGKLQ